MKIERVYLIMDIEQYQPSSIEIEKIINTKDSSYDNTIENIIEVCKAIDKNSSIKTPEFMALLWKFIYNNL